VERTSCVPVSYAVSRRLIRRGIPSAVAVAAAVAWGDYLLGTTAAVVFGLLSAGVLFVVWRVFALARKFRRFQQVVVIVFAASVLSVLAFPVSFSPDLHHFIERHRIERLTQGQLRTVFQSSPKYADLCFSCYCRKCIVVEVSGRIDNEADLRALRQMIFDTCPHVSSRWLFWNLIVQQTNATYNRKCDIDFVPVWGGTGIDGKVITKAEQI
jgi:hypothetical protein